ncbi:MAG: hypothetical protein NC394_06685 [Bacteroides sp.]|nr:hypothetical protein [Bacteroides sp.]
MQICRTVGGYSYGRADLVRRAMAKKKKDVMEKERSAFVYGTETNCGAIKNGVSEETANEIFDEMSAFASYAFNKSHAAAYAWLAYQTAYLRCHFYKEYMIALMTSVMDSAGKLNEYISDLEKHRVRLLPPDVNSSFLDFSIEGDSVRYGLLAIKNLGRGVINAIVERRKNGSYISLYDFCSRLIDCDLNKRAVEALIKSGALDSLGHNRRSMFMCFESILSRLSSNRNTNVDGQIDMFGGGEESGGISGDFGFEMPQVEEYGHSQLLQMEKESAGFYITGHPVDRYDGLRKKIGSKNIYTLITAAKEGRNGFKDGQKQPLVAMLVSKRQHMQKNGKQMCFAEFEDRSGSIEGVIFSDIYEKSIGILSEGKVFKLIGAISSSGGYRDDDDPKLIVHSIEPAVELAETKTLYIRLPSEREEISDEAKGLLSDNPGRDSVRLCFEDTRKTAVPKGISGVKIAKELVEKLEKICGKSNILIK